MELLTDSLMSAQVPAQDKVVVKKLIEAFLTKQQIAVLLAR